MTAYPCVYWIDHLIDSLSERIDPRDLDQVDSFLQQKYLYWLEALGLISKIPAGIVSLGKLQTMVYVGYLYNPTLLRCGTDLSRGGPRSRW